MLLPLLIALRLNDVVLPVPVCMPAFLIHQALADAPETSRLSHAAWVAINLPCGDF